MKGKQKNEKAQIQAAFVEEENQNALIWKEFKNLIKEIEDTQQRKTTEQLEKQTEEATI